MSIFRLRIISFAAVSRPHFLADQWSPDRTTCFFTWDILGGQSTQKFECSGPPNPGLCSLARSESGERLALLSSRPPEVFASPEHLFDAVLPPLEPKQLADHLTSQLKEIYRSDSSHL